MFVIRTRKKRKSSGVFSKNILEIILVEKKKALYSNAHKIKLGTYNKRTNIVSIKLDIVYFWIGFGVDFSMSSFKILKGLIF